MADTHVWVGQSGKAYKYVIVSIDHSNWKDEPGNYIFAKKTTSGWDAIYIGQTESFKDRPMHGHPRTGCAKAHGGAHIHARVNSGGKAARIKEEADLVDRHNPPCNKQ
jgi:hypothetical protein